ncbi:MAG: gluconate 2-dehydrogenase subunit 3 family protein [Acidobacteria bacterium]|nr:gluconate 2-dehydrogenase subunit 3 family protein [Acidobacteriota bacterium]
MGISNPHLNRRDALRRLAAGALGAAAAPAWVQSLAALARERAYIQATTSAASAPGWTPKALTPAQNEAVIALTEIIIPETDTPGAKAAKVNQFVDWVLADAPAAERDKFTSGLAWVDGRSRARFGQPFAAASPEQQTALLTPLAEAESGGAASAVSSEDATGVAFFRAIKSLTINGYYSTEIGLRQALGDDGQMFVPVFRGCDHPEHQ